MANYFIKIAKKNAGTSPGVQRYEDIHRDSNHKDMFGYPTKETVLWMYFFFCFLFPLPSFLRRNSFGWGKLATQIKDCRFSTQRPFIFHLLISHKREVVPPTVPSLV